MNTLQDGGKSGSAAIPYSIPIPMKTGNDALGDRLPGIAQSATMDCYA